MPDKLVYADAEGVIDVVGLGCVLGGGLRLSPRQPLLYQWVHGVLGAAAKLHLGGCEALLEGMDVLVLVAVRYRQRVGMKGDNQPRLADDRAELCRDGYLDAPLASDPFQK